MTICVGYVEMCPCSQPGLGRRLCGHYESTVFVRIVVVRIVVFCIVVVRIVVVRIVIVRIVNDMVSAYI